MEAYHHTFVGGKDNNIGIIRMRIVLLNRQTFLCEDIFTPEFFCTYNTRSLNQDLVLSTTSCIMVQWLLNSLHAIIYNNSANYIMVIF